jgi:crossover junction endodeoxyribonuclease RuvC
MIILGIDPGYERLGCAVIKKDGSKDKLIFSSCLTSHKSLPQEKRLALLSKELQKIIKRYEPDFMGVEKVFFTKNQKTASMVSEALGMILTTAGLENIPVEQMSPPEIKMAITGYGAAEKRQVQKMIQLILKMEKLPKYDDEADAIAIALAFSARLSTLKNKLLDK